ncbi:hypothetical protein ACFWXO_11395 [Kitasatospora sp. NPDC059088]|uniref:hypothetical protein n=1 Tax=Kitasatospora sp. NPDC059088 TaxID=3346722 RepID=UPI0036870FF3
MATTASGIYEHFLGLLGPGDGGAHRPGPRAGADTWRGSARARYGEWSDAAGHTHPAFLTRDEWVRNQIDLARCLDGLLTEDDVVIVAVPYELSFVGAEVERAIELVGAAVIGVGTSDTICPLPRVLDLMGQYGATVLVCSATVAARLAALAVARGQRPADSAVRLVVTTGEASSAERRERVAALWGADASELYGTASTPTVAVPCAAGALHLCDHRLRAAVRTPGADGPAAFRGELLLAFGTADTPDTPDTPDAPNGANGANGAAEPTGQFVELGPADGGCGCGARSPVLAPLGRVAELVGSASGPVSAVDVERIVFGFPEFAPYFAAELRPGGFTVTCAVPDGAAAAADEVLRQAVEAEVRRGLGIDVDVRIVEAKDWEAVTS